ncbi:MAG: hypothetical protein HOP35_01025 [Nitrospira sp.]|nr:hypothetical protein [Nitrospira sp.]
MTNDPLTEPLYRRLIELLVAQDRQADARRWYQRCVRALRDWEGRDLSPDTLRLGQRLAGR